MTTYAETVETASPSRTALLHHPAELRYQSCDDQLNIVHFVSASNHQPGHLNTTSYDVITGDIHCDCKGAQCGHTCWHGAWVAAAWERHDAMRRVRVLSTPALVRYGQRQCRMVELYRQRIGRVLPLDAVNLIAARCEYRRRHAIAVEMPLAA